MTTATAKPKIETFKFRGVITGTSNKLSADFANDNPRKTAYVKVDKVNERILLDNGCRLYTSKEGDDFFIIKIAEKVNAWVGANPFEMETTIDSENFMTESPVYIGCIKGRSKGKNYVRIYALGLSSMDDIFTVEKENPFADIEGFAPPKDIEGFTPTDEDIPF